MEGQDIRRAFANVGAALGTGRPIEILVVGGAAGMLTGQLSGSATTGDVDLLHCHMPADRDLVLETAGDVTRTSDLPGSWLNDFGGLYAWTLPHGWASRRMLIGKFGRLHVYAVGRLDLITMKLLAHRSGDLQHLRDIRPTADEFAFATERFDELEQDFPGESDRIAMARSIVANWDVTS